MVVPFRETHSLKLVEFDRNTWYHITTLLESRMMETIIALWDHMTVCRQMTIIVWNYLKPHFLKYLIETENNYFLNIQAALWKLFSLNYNHYHYVVQLARISPTLSRYFSLSFISSGRSSGLNPVSSHSCCVYVRAGSPAFARPYVGVLRVHHLWARPCFSSSVLHAWFV